MKLKELLNEMPVEGNKAPALIAGYVEQAKRALESIKNITNRMTPNQSKNYISITIGDISKKIEGISAEVGKLANNDSKTSKDANVKKTLI